MRHRRDLVEDTLSRRRRTPAGAFFLCGLLTSLSACLGAREPADERAGARDTTESGAVSAVDADGFAAADSIVSEWIESGRIAGAVLSLSVGGGAPLERARGYAHLYDFGEGQYPGGAGPVPVSVPEEMTVETLFDLASVTKVMATTMAVMLLVDRGEVDLDEPASRYLPDWVGDGRETITVAHLLTHRSGLPQWLPTYYHAANADDAWAYVRSRPLVWPVGQERHYSDLGFMTLGRLVETVTGRALNDFVREELYAPLGLERTGFLPTRRAGTADGPFARTSHGNPFERRMVHDPDFGYRIAGAPDAWDEWRRYTLAGEVNDGNAHHAFGGVAGHAGLFAPASELQILLRVLLDGGRAPDGSRLIGSDTVTRFLAPTGDGQALGWQLPAYAPRGSFGHTGFTGTFVLGVPEHDLSIVLLTNRQNTGVDENTSYVDVGALQRAVVGVFAGAGSP